MIVILVGAKVNLGDFLIGSRAEQLLKEFVDEEIIALDRFKDLTPHIEIINSARMVILCGGPAYAKNFHPGVYPLVDDLSKIKVPIVPFGLGWSGSPANEPDKFAFDAKSLEAIKTIHAGIEKSSCRDVLTASILENHGIENVEMTGCPVWYHLPSVGKGFKKPTEVQKIVLTTPASHKLLKQTLQVLKLVKKKYPKAQVYLSFHRGILGGKGNGPRKRLAYLGMCIGAKLISLKTKITNVAYDLKKIDYYNDCDLHIGYRVHAHLYFLSKRLPSVLLNEDGRGRGQVLSMNLPELNIDDPEVMDKLSKVMQEDVDNNFSRYDNVEKLIDNNFELMKKFLIDLNERY